MARLIEIQVLRGNQADVLALSNIDGELLFASDKKRLFISDGVSKTLVGRAESGLDANRPTADTSINGLIYEATDTGKLYVCVAGAWVTAGVTDLSDLSGDLDDIANGTTYGKVKVSELNSGQVVQLRAETASVNITGDTINTHISDDTKHRLISDGTNSTTVLWSGQYLKGLFDAVNNGTARVPKVIDIVDNTAIPPTTNSGDRYILDFTLGGVHADWDGADVGDLVEFDGANWVIKVDASDVTKEGTKTYVDAQNKDAILVNDGTPTWELINLTIPDHNNLSGLNVGDYKHLTASEYTKATVQAGNGNTLGLMSDTDKSKLDGVEAGADDNQDITAQKGTKRTDINALNGDAVIEADFEDTDANIQAVLKGTGDGVAGTSDKVARADHQHRLLKIDGGQV